jgi:hypothetical protein
MWIDIIFILLITGFVIWKSFIIVKKKSVGLIKKRRYFTKPNELGVYYEEDENGKITKFQDGQNY